MTERLHFHFSLSRIGEGNGNPLRCSCLENPRDGEPGGLPPMGSHRVDTAEVTWQQQQQCCTRTLLSLSSLFDYLCTLLVTYFVLIFLKNLVN